MTDDYGTVVNEREVFEDAYRESTLADSAELIQHMGTKAFLVSVLLKLQDGTEADNIQSILIDW